MKTSKLTKLFDHLHSKYAVVLLKHKLNSRNLTLFFGLCLVALILSQLGVGKYLTVTKAATQNSQSPTTPIAHIIIMDKENRTFDNYFGTFPGSNGSTTYTSSTGAVLT